MNLRRHQTLTLRLLAASAGILSAAAFAAPAQANPVDDAFIAALNNAGVNYGDPVDAKARWVSPSARSWPSPAGRLTPR